jgi:outer membrane protein assembly factor BamD (BamD/ComL family)
VIEGKKVYAKCTQTYPKSEVADDCLFAIAKLLEKEKKYPEAIAKNMQIVKTYATRELADDALYTAIVLHDKRLKDLPKAYALSVQFRKTYPHSEYLDKAAKVEAKTLRYVQ